MQEPPPVDTTDSPIWEPTRKKRDSWVKRLFSTRIDLSTGRIRFVALCFFALYLVIGGRLVYLGSKPERPQSLRLAASEAVSAALLPGAK